VRENIVFHSLICLEPVERFWNVIKYRSFADSTSSHYLSYNNYHHLFRTQVTILFIYNPICNTNSALKQANKSNEAISSLNHELFIRVIVLLSNIIIYYDHCKLCV